MATPDILVSAPEVPTPVNATGVLASASASGTAATSDTLSPAPTVASTIASVSDVIGQQMEIAAVTQVLRARFVPLLPGFSMSTGIDGEKEVGEVAEAVNGLIAVRKSRAELRV